MLSAVEQLFAWWYRFRGEARAGEGLLSRTESIEQSIPIPQKICRLAARHLDSEDREVRNLASAMYKHRESLWPDYSP